MAKQVLGNAPVVAEDANDRVRFFVQPGSVEIEYGSRTVTINKMLLHKACLELVAEEAEAVGREALKEASVTFEAVKRAIKEDELG